MEGLFGAFSCPLVLLLRERQAAIEEYKYRLVKKATRDPSAALPYSLQFPPFLPPSFLPSFLPSLPPCPIRSSLTRAHPTCGFPPKTAPSPAPPRASTTTTAQTPTWRTAPSSRLCMAAGRCKCVVFPLSSPLISCLPVFFFRLATLGV